MKRVIKWILGLAVFGIVCLYSLSFYIFGAPETNIAYQTDDGEWADGEILFKGRDFEGIVFGYELYKIVCQKPHLKLQRTTQKPEVWNIEWWFDDFNEPKWLVPYTKPHNNLNGEKYYRPEGMDHCANKGVKPELLDIAGKRASEYIAKLQKTHNK
jgi:hypothetical protein